jgi:hypothetical protein
MAYTVKVNTDESQTVYVLIFDSEGKCWNGTTFVTFTGVNADFDVALTEDTNRTGYYTAALGSAPDPDTYVEEVWQQAGGAPDRAADTRVGVQAKYWRGDQETAFQNRFCR